MNPSLGDGDRQALFQVGISQENAVTTFYLAGLHVLDLALLWYL